jgi:hypothetical protein
MERRTFLKTSAIASVGLMASDLSFARENIANVQVGKRVGIIGLDTSHATAFTQLLNGENASAEMNGYKVVAAFPRGSADIESSVSRIPRFTEEVQRYGVRITASIDELLSGVDKVLLLTNDGRPHLAQALQVFRAGKPVFIDKPVAGTLTDAIAIFQAAKDMNRSVFSSSGLRYISNIDAVKKERAIGDVLGVDAYSPCIIEPTHPDLFWYGVHGVETLFTAMGTGCKTVTRFKQPDHELVVGQWDNQRIGTFRGLRAGRVYNYGGTAFGSEGIQNLGTFVGYAPLMTEIVKFFNTGISPVSAQETIEIFTFMEAADESKRRAGAQVDMNEVLQKATAQVRKTW